MPSLMSEDSSSWCFSCLVDSCRQTSLSRFIESLSFPARFWYSFSLIDFSCTLVISCYFVTRDWYSCNTMLCRTLLVRSCFQKFDGMPSDKEILRSCQVTESRLGPLLWSWSFRFSPTLSSMVFFIFARCYQKDELTKIYAESRIPPSMFQPRVNW